jgi:DNA polymerase-3 subunit epsilon
MILFFDTETTGLPKKWKAPVTDLDNWPRLVQLAYLVYDFDGNLIHSCNEIVKPDGFTIPLDTSKVHGITTDIANQRGSKIEEVFELFSIHLKRAKVIVAHNMAYDEKIIGSELIRLGFQNILDEKVKICTMESTVDLCKINGPYGYKWPKLEELHRFLFNHDFNGAHDALADIQATAKCFWEMFDRKLIHLTKFVRSRRIDSFENDKIVKINEAIESNDKIRIIYKNTDNEITTRILSKLNYSKKVLPLEEIIKFSIDDNFITGFCHKRQDTRTFCIDRIIQLDVLKKSEKIDVSMFEDKFIIPIKNGDLFNFCCWEIKSENTSLKFYDYLNLEGLSYQFRELKIKCFNIFGGINVQESWNSWQINYELKNLGDQISNYSVQFGGQLKLDFSQHSKEFLENYARLFPETTINDNFCGIRIAPFNQLIATIVIGHSFPPEDWDDFGMTCYDPIVFIDAFGKIYWNRNKCNDHQFFETYPYNQNLIGNDEDDSLPF